MSAETTQLQSPSKMTKTRIAAILLAVVLVIVGVLLFVFRVEIQRLRFATRMFSGAEMVEPFRSLYTMFPSTTVKGSTNPSPLPVGETITLPTTYEYEGQALQVQTLLDETDTTGLLVIKDGEVVFEEQYRGNKPSTQTISWSVAKSFVSALVGIAIEEGQIGSIDEPITQYVPELKGSAYEGVKIKDILQMSSGARWNEDYNDWNSDINRFGRIFSMGGSFDTFTATLEREFEPGTFNRYNSMDTQTLAMMLVRATDESLTTYLEEKIWQPVGMESDSYWLTDDEGVEMAFGGLNATLRDYARFGLLYLNNGHVGDKQIVPADWVQASVVADGPHLQPGKDNPDSDFPLGYGLQWWVMDGDEGEFSAIGIYNQFVYVNPTRALVIVKTSASSNYASTPDESSYRELETIEFFRAIGRKFPISSGDDSVDQPPVQATIPDA